MRGKYAPLYHHLLALPAREWRASFHEIEAILGFPLPASAHRHSAWWANGGGHGHALSWLAAGWEACDVSPAAKTVVFLRKSGGTKVARSPAPRPAHATSTKPVPPSRPASDGPLPAADLCLVSCVKTKRDRPVPARELYRSDWFIKVRALVECHGWPWRILSARYGLLHPDRTVEPYEKTLSKMGAEGRRAWAGRVIADLDPLLDGGACVLIFAGQDYRQHLEAHLRRRGIEVHVPMAGLKQGQQLSWLARQGCR